MTSQELPLSRHMDFSYGEPSVMADGISRLVAPNPGPYTFKGTNTYLLGRCDVAVIDPGPNDADHIAAILEAAPGPITHILITHTHRDHIDAVPALKAATGATVYGYGHTPPGDADEAANVAYRPDIVLRDGDVIETNDWRLEAIHTPGHAPDHLCFALEAAKLVFSGDHIMGWNTSVIAPPDGNMDAYFASLEKLLDRSDALFFPGHGGRVREPARVVKAFLVHRKMRENAILAAIREGLSTTDALVDRIYPGIAPEIAPAAGASILAHVERLVARHQIACSGPLGPDARFSAVD